MNNLLDSISFTLINFTKPEIGGIASVVKWLVGICSSVALGIILFTIVLKLITFPFDFFSRYSMRKNSVKMEEMRPELERLQKQYADNKALYNQKMMALYKKNGYSMWGSCLPTILTLVIFIIAINGFSSYSRFQNKEYFYNMSLSYNSALYDEIEFDNNYIVKGENGVVLNAELLKTKGVGDFDTISITNDTEGVGYYITTPNYKYTIHCDKDFNIYKENGFIAKSEEILTATKEVARQRSAEKYRAEKTSFLWVKNIWNTDSPIEHPIYAKWETKAAGCASCFGGDKGFKQQQAYENNEFGNMNQALYDELTYNLTTEKAEANGYFILCILSAVVSFLMQLVMSKSQKAQMELQTVNGQGAQQQKMMLWMIPIMMAFFSFMYTAAFSIYLILSSVISILTTFFINWVVDKKLGKVKASQNTKQIIRGRVYNKSVENKKNGKKKEVKKAKVRDFIQGNEEDKSIRDRLK